MLIRSYRPEDRPDLEVLLRATWGGDPWAQRYFRVGPESPPESARFSRTLVVEVDGVTAGSVPPGPTRFIPTPSM